MFQAVERATVPGMWQPTTRQWPVIWMAVIVALGFWIYASYDHNRKVAKAFPYERCAVAVVILGGIAAWQLGPRKA